MITCGRGAHARVRSPPERAARGALAARGAAHLLQRDRLLEARVRRDGSASRRRARFLPQEELEAHEDLAHELGRDAARASHDNHQVQQLPFHRRVVEPRFFGLVHERSLVLLVRVAHARDDVDVHGAHSPAPSTTMGVKVARQSARRAARGKVPAPTHLP